MVFNHAITALTAMMIPETKTPNNGSIQESPLKRLIRVKYANKPIKPPESNKNNIIAMPMTMEDIAANFLNLVLKSDFRFVPHRQVQFRLALHSPTFLIAFERQEAS